MDQLRHRQQHCDELSANEPEAALRSPSPCLQRERGFLIDL